MHHVHIAMYSQVLQLYASDREWEYVFILPLGLHFQTDINLQRVIKMHENQDLINFCLKLKLPKYFLCKLNLTA